MIGRLVLATLLLLAAAPAGAQPQNPPLQTKLNGSSGVVTFIIDFAGRLTRSCTGSECVVGVDQGASYTWTGPHDFGGAKVELPNGTTCASADCDAVGELGRVCIDTDATAGQTFLVCTDLGGSTYGWRVPSLRVTIGGGSPPGTRCERINFSNDFTNSESGGVCDVAPGSSFFMEGEAILASQLPATLAADNVLRYFGTDQDFSLKFDPASGKMVLAGSATLRIENTLDLVDKISTVNVSTAMKTGQWSYGIEDFADTDLPDFTFESWIINKSRAVTITLVCCEAASGSPTVNIKKNASTNIISGGGTVTCSNNATPTTGGTGCTSSFAATAIAVNDTVDIVFDNNAGNERLNLTVTYTVDDD